MSALHEPDEEPAAGTLAWQVTRPVTPELN
jgi:hypothetical protein